MVGTWTWTGALSMIVAALGTVAAQGYPVKPLRIIVPGTGGAGDFTARLIAQGISGPLGQQVIIDNRPTGIVPGELTAKAPADGYTLLLSGSSLWLAPYMQDSVLYDPVKDFAAITLATSSPNVAVVHPSVPAYSIRELIALARSRPGALNYGSGGAGTSQHLAGELFKTMARVNIVRIAYKGGGPAAIADLLSGQTQLVFPTAPLAAQHIKSGRLRALAVTSAESSALVPGLPSIAASGLPGYESISMYGMFAPARTPEAAIARLNQEIVRVLSSADAKAKFFSMGVEAAGSSSEHLAAKVKSEMTRMGKVIRDAGIRAE